MEIIDISTNAGFQETRFDSRGFTVTPLARQAANVVVVQVTPGGCIGRHPAIGRQVFAVVAGSGRVCGAEGVWQPIGVGQAAVWGPGELHETSTESGLTAVISEGPELGVERLRESGR